MNQLSQRDRITQYLQNAYGTEPEHLWAQYPTYEVFRHTGSKKWYGAIMAVPKNKLGLSGEDAVDVLDVKCSSILMGSLLTQAGFLPGYHMNKSAWITILLDESVPDDTIFPLLEFSYDSVAPRKKARHLQSSK